MNWLLWLKGIISAASGTAAASIGTMIADPDNFNFTSTGLKKVGIVAAFTAGVAVLNHLSKSPLPDKNTGG